jgi:hypothetical protein
MRPVFSRNQPKKAPERPKVLGAAPEVISRICHAKNLTSLKYHLSHLSLEIIDEMINKGRKTFRKRSSDVSKSALTLLLTFPRLSSPVIAFPRL